MAFQNFTPKDLACARVELTGTVTSPAPSCAETPTNSVRPRSIPLHAAFVRCFSESEMGQGSALLAAYNRQMACQRSRTTVVVQSSSMQFSLVFFPQTHRSQERKRPFHTSLWESSAIYGFRDPSFIVCLKSANGMSSYLRYGSTNCSKSAQRIRPCTS